VRIGDPSVGPATRPDRIPRPSRRAIWPVLAAVLLAAGSVVLAPRGFEAGALLLAQDDPVRLADHALDKVFSQALAEREIAAALDAGDIDLADSFVALARERAVAIDAVLMARVEAAHGTAATAQRNVTRFARGLVTGEPTDAVGLAGTALGDLFVFGDARDAVREGVRLAKGEAADELVLGLACAGLAVTAGTYATIGAGAPVRAGLSLVKAARKTQRLGARLAGWLARTARETVDAAALRRAVVNVSLTEPGLALRAAREAVKVEKAQDLFRAARDAGRIEAKAGTQAALDGLKVAEGPRDMSRLARLAEAKGGKTRAILRLLGRGAIALTVAAVDLASWLFSALLALFGFCAAVKGATERATLRYVRWRKRRRARLAAKLCKDAEPACA
jgi:hypothetical protein